MRIGCIIKYKFICNGYHDIVLIYGNNIIVDMNTSTTYMKLGNVSINNVYFSGAQLYRPLKMYHNCDLSKESTGSCVKFGYKHDWKQNRWVRVSGFVGNGTPMYYDIAEVLYKTIIS